MLVHESKRLFPRLVSVCPECRDLETYPVDRRSTACSECGRQVVLPHESNLEVCSEACARRQAARREEQEAAEAFRAAVRREAERLSRELLANTDAFRAAVRDEVNRHQEEAERQRAARATGTRRPGECRSCGGDLGHRRELARYCSDACKQRHYRERRRASRVL